MKKIVIASDSFKGSLSTTEVADAIAVGIKRVYPEVSVQSFPIADGGEGTLDSILTAANGQRITVTVHDPIGREIKADYGILSDHIAIIEMATASGLTRLSATERNPMAASTFGTGELILDALDRGCRKFYIGIGGSATNDGGAGMAQALGAKLLNGEGRELSRGGAALKALARIDLSQMDVRIGQSVFTVLSDVDNPLCGERGASVVYGPQKGATPEMVQTLDAALAHYGALLQRDLKKDVSEKPGAGAAGGLGAGLMAFCSASLMPGVSAVLSMLNFEEALKTCDLVITGEGQMDFQTAYGKAPIGIAAMAKRYHLPVIAIVGSKGTACETVYAHGIDAVFSILDKPMTLETAMHDSAELVANCAENIMRTFKLAARE